MKIEEFDVIKNSRKPFKSGKKIGIVIGECINLNSNKDAYIIDDGSVVDKHQCLPLKWEPINKGKYPDCLMTIQEFIESCNCCAFIDDDGYGVYASSDKKSNIYVVPSDIKKGRILKEFTHIVWYNK